VAGKVSSRVFRGQEVGWTVAVEVARDVVRRGTEVAVRKEA
jgi:hypothetical protein